MPAGAQMLHSLRSIAEPHRAVDLKHASTKWQPVQMTGTLAALTSVRSSEKVQVVDSAWRTSWIAPSCRRNPARSGQASLLPIWSMCSAARSPSPAQRQFQEHCWQHIEMNIAPRGSCLAWGKACILPPHNSESGSLCGRKPEFEPDDVLDRCRGAPEAMQCRNEMKWCRTAGDSSSARPKSSSTSCSCRAAPRGSPAGAVCPAAAAAGGASGRGADAACRAKSRCDTLTHTGPSSATMRNACSHWRPALICHRSLINVHSSTRRASKGSAVACANRNTLYRRTCRSARARTKMLPGCRSVCTKLSMSSIFRYASTPSPTICNQAGEADLLCDDTVCSYLSRRTVNQGAEDGVCRALLELDMKSG